MSIILLLLAILLNVYNLSRLGWGNSYYAASIKSMLTSFHNFFFVSFDSTGFISVDKAPLSLWLDTISAKLFGFSGVAILLPHAIAGVLVTFLVYKISRKVWGKIPALVAGLVVTLSPVNVAVYRNNTPDSLLLVFVLLSLWFMLKFFDQKKMKFLLLSALMLGLGFNTKMLQAFLILPAYFIALTFCLKEKFTNRIKIMAIYAITLAIVSISWITIVDLTPSNLRPFVGGSDTNSAWNLALGYNGVQRWQGETGKGGNPGFNVGSKGITRLLSGELGGQAGWFLATAIGFCLYFGYRNWKNIKSIKDRLLSVINIIFLVTQFVFFSYASFFHSYYLNILVLPIAFLIGDLTNDYLTVKLNNWALLLIVFISIPVQIGLIAQTGYSPWLIPLILFLGVSSVILIMAEGRARICGEILMVASLFITPLIWSGYTTLYGNTAVPIFSGGPGVSRTNNRGIGPGGGGMFTAESTNQGLLAYLKKNNTNEKYFVGVTSQQQATGFILENNISNIMTLGGFSGRDQAISLSQFQEKIANKEIRFFISDNEGRQGFGTPNRGGMFSANQEIVNWVKTNCTAVEKINGLYDCR